ncbi:MULTISPECIES: cyclic nucleotide-binding domain-containing protein [Olivibacter]|uniref:CRP-like cAMP-binding protein n=1 Tax=Olivibacter jilunii TaxID=985016 RepID=A0ABW6BB45_9SPHI|nr:hypothetical protein [Pseudosphingobacterium sp.]
MQRLFDFWERYMRIPDDARLFLERHGIIKQFTKGAIFSQPDDARQYWCFVLEGLVAGNHYRADGQRIVRWLLVPYSYFTGTEHLYTKRSGNVHIEFLKSTALFMLRNEIAVEGQRRFWSISELFHILKQHQINRLRKYALIFQQPSHYQKYKLLVEELPEIVAQTTNEQRWHYLQISKGSYYKVKKRYLRQG